MNLIYLISELIKDKKMKLHDLITPDLDPLDFYEYLEEYSEPSDLMQWGWTREEQQIIDEAWDEIKQEYFGDRPNISKIAESQIYLDYVYGR